MVILEVDMSYNTVENVSSSHCENDGVNRLWNIFIGYINLHRQLNLLDLHNGHQDQ